MKKYLPLLIALTTFLSAIFVLVFISTRNTDSIFLYTLDDPYIHMAIAKNLVNSGIWGVTKNEFTSCSSSPLWGLLISLSFFTFGVKDVIPFILNVFFSILTAFVVFKFIRKFTENGFIITFVLLVILFFSPFVTVAFTGLEHSLYAMVIILVTIYIYKIIEEKENKKSIYILFFLVFLLTSIRYEGMFAAFSMFLIFLYRRKYFVAFLIPLFAFIPFLINGLVSVSNNWSFFPNSILLKSPVPVSDFWSFLKQIFYPRFLNILWAHHRILILVVLSIVVFLGFRKSKETQALKSLIFFFVSVALLHLQFAMTGSLLRYEMYIIAIGIFVNAVLLIKYLNGKNLFSKLIFSFLILLLSVLFSLSTIKAAKDVSTAATNIYQMQYQMARFTNKFYKEKPIALNDIGAVNYYSDIKCIDLWGLANRDVGIYRREKTYNTEKIYNINKEKNTEISIVFEAWFSQFGGLPKNWVEAGKWTIPNNITCGADSVTFFATDSLYPERLRSNLKIFSKELPSQVLQKGY